MQNNNFGIQISALRSLKLKLKNSEFKYQFSYLNEKIQNRNVNV